METKVNLAVVGAFVLALLVALIAGVLWLAAGGVNQNPYHLYAASVEESVAGLNPNAPVKYNGVDVGKVKRIGLDASNPQRVNLLFQIERGTPVKEDTVATLKTQGLTGIAFVELSGGSPQAPMLVARAGEDYPVIQTKPSLSTRLETVLTDVLARLDSTSGTINEVLSPANRAAFSSALADIADVARTIAARKQTLDVAITRAGQMLQNTAKASDQLAPLLERVARSATAIEQMGNSISATSSSAGKTIEVVDKTVVSVGKTVDTVGADVQRFSNQTLPEIERLMGELTALAASLRRLSDQTERDPRGLLFGRQPLPPGPGEQTRGARP